MKKFLIFVVVAMLSTVARGEVGDIFSYEKLDFRVLSEDEHTVEVYSYRDFIIGEFVIPSVVVNGTSSYDVIQIGKDAFYGSGGITSITIPNTVTQIGAGAFHLCNSLTSITIPESVIEIGELVFQECSSLTEIIVENGNPNYTSEDGVLFSIDKKELLTCPGGKTGVYTIPSSVTRIGENAFYSCYSLTSVIIPSSVTEIGRAAFTGSTITSIDIPNSVTEIGEYAFSNNYCLTSVTIPDSITVIEEYMFYYCHSLTSVTIPESVTKIGKCAFCSCLGLNSIIIPDSVIEIGEYAFMETPITSIIIPDSVIKIGKSAFCHTLLTSVTIPQSVTKIEPDTFAICRMLESVTIPESVIEIGESAFFYCERLASVTIPESVTKIGDYAFGNCLMLTSVTFPNSVTEIGERAFSGCMSLGMIIIFGADTQIGVDAFDRCSNLSSIYDFSPVPQVAMDNAFSGIPFYATVYIPKGSINEYSVAPEWSRFYYFQEMGNIEVVLSELFVRCTIGDTVIITTAVYMEDDMYEVSEEWSSSNPDVATVEDGNVTAIAPGEAEIYFTVVDNYGQSHTKSCMVIVENHHTDIADIPADASSEVDVFNLEGREVLRGVSAAELDRLTPGIYIVRSGNNVKKISVK